MKQRKLGKFFIFVMMKYIIISSCIANMLKLFSVHSMYTYVLLNKYTTGCMQLRIVVPGCEYSWCVCILCSFVCLLLFCIVHTC